MKLRRVAKKDVEDAAMIAELMGGADLAGTSFCCVDNVPRKRHDCPDCDHFERVAECEHQGGEWECVASAIGASSRALDLWMTFSNACFTTRRDRENERHYLESDTHRHFVQSDKRCRDVQGKIATELRDHDRLYAWVDTIRQGGIQHGRRGLGYNELEVAYLLREGYLPPGWEVVAKHKASAGHVTSRRRSRRSDSKRNSVMTGRLPVVRIVMTASGPKAER